MNNDKNEELRQNWHISEMTAGWRAERENHRDFTNRAIKKILAERDKKIKAVKEEAEARIEEINAEAEAATLAERHKLQDCLLLVARREDEYMHKFRNYVASLPKDDLVVYDMHRE